MRAFRECVRTEITRAAKQGIQRVPSSLLILIISAPLTNLRKAHFAPHSSELARPGFIPTNLATCQLFSSRRE
jgi:hypothetical protein